MNSFRNHRLRALAVPMSTAWLLNDIAEAKGKQELYTRQSPQVLKALREMAIRLTRLERAIPPQRVPLLHWLPTPDEREPGQRITRGTLRKIWLALGFLLAAAAAAGYWTAHVGRLR